MFILALIYLIILVAGIFISYRANGWSNLAEWVLFLIIGYVLFFDVLNK